MASSSPNRSGEGEGDTSPLLPGSSRPSGEMLHDSETTSNFKPLERNGEVMQSRSSWYLFLLTLGIGGLQIVWSVELSNGSPYLLSLGMSKSLLAIVWIAGPLTGTLVQPYIGIRSDNCRIRWGKRKPFMIGGGIATVISLLALAWVREIVGGTLGLFGAAYGSEVVKVTTIVMATILMFCLDLAINTVQAALRAFIVDNAPASQQEVANAWASRLTGIGNILGYIFGYIRLPKILPFLGNTQFKVLCVIASFSLSATLLISCLYITELDPRLDGHPQSDNPGVISFFVQVFRSIKRLPPKIKRVCEVQVCAWIGWFPFLFYSTTYIGQLYVNPIFEKHPQLSEGEIDDAWEAGTRAGTFALLIYAITSFVSSIVLPLLVVPTYRPVTVDPSDSENASDSNLNLRTSTSTLSFSTPAASGAAIEPSHVPVKYMSGRSRPLSLLSKLQIPGLTLRRMWLFSHILFALCMFNTVFISSPIGGTVLIAIIGLPWALTLWAPFALISAEIAQLTAEHRRQRNMLRDRAPSSSNSFHSQTNLDDERGADDGFSHTSTNDTSPTKPDDDVVDQAGIILGIHNVAISFPQIISTMVSSAIFKAFQKPRGEPWDDSVGWVFRFGGCAALGAAWFTMRLSDGAVGRGKRVGSDSV